MESCKINEKKCGKVSIEERDEIKSLYSRKNALSELFLVLPKLENSAKEELYEKLVIDMGKTTSLFSLWWDNKSKQYGWEKEENSNWRIDFETCDIFLVSK